MGALIVLLILTNVYNFTLALITFAYCINLYIIYALITFVICLLIYLLCKKFKVFKNKKSKVSFIIAKIFQVFLIIEMIFYLLTFIISIIVKYTYLVSFM